MQRVERHASFGGIQEIWEHRSATLGCDMRLGIYLPSRAQREPCHVLYWLSGLTCTEENFITKAGAQQYADQHGLIIVAPDTSPRGEDVPDDEAYDLGQGAGFYLNASQSPWAQHYQMHDYVVEELPTLMSANFPVTDRMSVSGHSMGGHGALIVALRNPGKYRSVSAFSPVAAPSRVPWGRKAFAEYLGEDKLDWRPWDTVELIRAGAAKIPLLVEQGESDQFLSEQLQPERLEAACHDTGFPLDLRMHPGFDHSYYFIASFIGDHVAYHAHALAKD